MEQKLLSDFEQILQNQTEISPLSLKPYSLARSLIVNPSTSDLTISSLLKTLETLTPPITTKTPKFSLLHVISLLSEISALRPHFSSSVAAILHSLSLHAPEVPPRSAALALSTIVSIAPLSDITEGFFLSLCFGRCVAVRHKLLLDAEKFDVRPSILLTVLLGFTKDPYPYVRMAALNGLVGLCKRFVVEDRCMIEGCYFRAVELLLDTEECVRCSAIHMVSEWGKVLVVNSEDESKADWSDAVYIQLCTMVRDMSVNVRVEAFDALGKVAMVSGYILMQTLSKKVLPITKEKKFPGQFSNVSASNAAGAFIHGLEDEFHEVRTSACYSMRTPAILSAEFASGALNLLMDVLNDDSMVVRLQALETMHHMAIFGHLKVQELHMHMFLGTLVDTNTLLRFAARKVLKLTKLLDLAMFKLTVDSLIQSLDTYPQDESDVLSVIFNIGRSHGSFTVSIIKEIFSEIEPSSEGNWNFDSSKTAARLVLAISAPLSHRKQQQSYTIPPIIFSYAVTMLERISRGLSEVMNRDTLLAYLSHFSRSNGVFPSEIVENDLSIEFKNQITCPVRLDMVQKSNGDSEIISQGLLEVHNEADTYVKFIFANIGEIWHLTKSGCISEGLTTLRKWKEELETFIPNPHQSNCVLAFTLQYLHIVKLLSKAWLHVMSPGNLKFNEAGDFELILGKLEKRLREVIYRFTGLSEEEELHIHELVLVTCILRLYTFDAFWHESTLKKLYSTISRIDFLYKSRSIELSRFVNEVMKFEDNGDIFQFQDFLDFFSLTQFILCKNFKYKRAEMEIQDNDWLNPFPFVPGLPVGIPLKIRVYNTPIDTKLWVKMTLVKDSNEYLFVDLTQFKGCEKMREFTFIAPFYRTPKVNSFILRICVGMECLSEDIHSFRGHGGPKHELVYLCKEKEVFLSMVVKK